jgi:hypothetical protein
MPLLAATPPANDRLEVMAADNLPLELCIMASIIATMSYRCADLLKWIISL